MSLASIVSATADASSYPVLELLDGSIQDWQWFNPLKDYNMHSLQHHSWTVKHCGRMFCTVKRPKCCSYPHSVTSYLRNTDLVPQIQNNQIIISPSPGTVPGQFKCGAVVPVQCWGWTRKSVAILVQDCTKYYHATA